MAEDVIPTAIINKIAESRKPTDDGEATVVADDGEGCVGTIGGPDVAGVNPLYRCAFDRKRCYPYGPVPPVVKGEAPNKPYCEGGMIEWPTFFSPAEQGSIDANFHRGDGLHRWVGSSTECITAWKAFGCAYGYDKCGSDGEVIRGLDAPNCHSRCLTMVGQCGNETISAMLKTTKRFIGQVRYERLAKVFHCDNFSPERGCLYATPSGGADDAVLWPGYPWDPEEGEIFLDKDQEEDYYRNLPEL